MMQPIDQTSTAVEYLRAPSSSSGARYHSVTTMCVYAASGEPYCSKKGGKHRAVSTVTSSTWYKERLVQNLFHFLSAMAIASRRPAALPLLMHVHA